MRKEKKSNANPSLTFFVNGFLTLKKRHTILIGSSQQWYSLRGKLLRGVRLGSASTNRSAGSIVGDGCDMSRRESGRDIHTI